MNSDTDEKYDMLEELASMNESEVLEQLTEHLKDVDWFSAYREQLWNARDEGHRATVIILLNTFFEAYLRDAFNRHYHEQGFDEKERFFIEGMTHSQILDQSRKLGLLSEDNYRILKNLNKARNAYAHDLLNWVPARSTEIEEQGEVKAAFTLHETVLREGVEALQED